MKEVTELYTSEVTLNCPHCGEVEKGFCVNPLGENFTCDTCGKDYKVSSDADIEHV